MKNIDISSIGEFGLIDMIKNQFADSKDNKNIWEKYLHFSDAAEQGSLPSPTSRLLRKVHLCVKNI